MAGLRVTVVSMEPWDAVWRRNQHIAARLVRRGTVSELRFVNPPVRTCEPVVPPMDGLEVLTPRLRLPPRLGGLAEVGWALRASAREADVLWINDAQIGRFVVSRDQPCVYDVTDDWRHADMAPRARRRLLRAEGMLARRATTVVCSEVLQQRWLERYGVHALLVPNGVDVETTRAAAPVTLSSAAPHIGYVGTLHVERLDIDMVVRLAESPSVGTLHLVGPDALDDPSRRRLRACGNVVLHGPVRSQEVPGWMKAMDVLVCPHLVTAFTMSLDAIKAREYLASGRPVVATPTSGFQHVVAPGVRVTRDVELAVSLALAEPGDYGERGAVDWDMRAADFGKVLTTAALGRAA